METFNFSNWFSGAGTFVLNRTLSAAATLAIGLLIIRLVLRLERTALEKTHLEKAAHSLDQSGALSAAGVEHRRLFGH